MSERGFLHEVTVHSKLSSQQALENWICEKKDYLISKLEKTGAILFSGLPVKDANDFDHFVSTFQFKAFTYGESLCKNKQN
jgi:hypothetical protein